MTLLIPTYVVKIGEYTFGGANEIRIERSIDQLGSKCTIKVPQTAVLRNELDTFTKLETAKAIKRGDKVSVTLGYDNINTTEFVGFVHHVNHKIPVEIECEDYIFLLKKKQVRKNISGKLSSAIKEILAGVNEVSAHPDSDDIEVKNLLLATDTGAAITVAQALEKIKEMFGLAAYFDIDGKLFVGLRYKKQLGRVKYALSGPKRNVINLDDLKYYRADEITLKIKYTSIDKTGARTEVEVGDENGSIREFYVYGNTSKQELETLAKNELERYKYDGYSGEIETFLQPNSQPGMIAEIIDPFFPDREGSYYIESVNTSLTQGGGRKIVRLSIKV